MAKALHYAFACTPDIQDQLQLWNLPGAIYCSMDLCSCLCELGSAGWQFLTCRATK